MMYTNNFNELTDVNLCGYCLKKNSSVHNFVNCALCKSRIHIKCNNIELKSYNKMEINKVIPICIKCNTENFPFYNEVKINISETYNKELLISDNIKMYFKGINDFSNNINDIDNHEEDFDITPIIDCKYLDINSFNLIKEDKFFFQSSILTLLHYHCTKRNLKMF